jgi:hypothetical protein
MKYTLKLLWNLAILLGRVGWILGGLVLGMIAIFAADDEDDMGPVPRSDLGPFVGKDQIYTHDGRFIVD